MKIRVIFKILIKNNCQNLVGRAIRSTNIILIIDINFLSTVLTLLYFYYTLDGGTLVNKPYLINIISSTKSLENRSQYLLVLFSRSFS